MERMSNDPRVLVVEDHDILRAMLFAVLRNQRLAVDTAPSLDDAIAKVTECHYALILVDMDLAGDGARQFLEQVRELGREETTFVIAVRDPNDDSHIDPNIVSAVLNKPLEIGTLADVVRECASVMPPPQEPGSCGPAESEMYESHSGSQLAN